MHVGSTLMPVKTLEIPKQGPLYKHQVRSVISLALWLSSERHLCCLSFSLIKTVCLQLNREIFIPRAKACTLFNSIEETNTSIDSVMRNLAIRKQRVSGLGRSLVSESNWRFCSWEAGLRKGWVNIFVQGWWRVMWETNELSKLEQYIKWYPDVLKCVYLS